MYGELCGQVFEALGASGCAVRRAERRCATSIVIIRTNINFGHRSYEYCTKVAECLARSTTVHTYSNPLTVNVSPFPTCTVGLLGSYCPHAAVIHCARV